MFCVTYQRNLAAAKAAGAEVLRTRVDAFIYIKC